MEGGAKPTDLFLGCPSLDPITPVFAVICVPVV